MLIYADTSALVKLIIQEPESEALRKWLGEHEVRLITCELTRTELLRAVRRLNERWIADVRRLLSGVAVLSIERAAYYEAGLIAPAELRTLDALHLSAALLLGEQLDGMLCYDNRLSDAAENMGITVFRPC